MDSQREGAGEESVPLVVAAEEVGSSSEVGQPKNHARDVHILGAAFLFVFSAYSAAQNLESTVNSEGDLGTTSMGILYLSFTLFSVVAAPVVRVLGSKRALVLGTTGYLLFIASNLKPSWYTMVPASLYLGFAASIIWVGQGTYLTAAAHCHAKDCHLPEASVIGNFNGEFWMMFASNQVVGNLISLALLRDRKTFATNPSCCTDLNPNCWNLFAMEEESIMGRNLLFAVFLGCMVFGVILMCLLSKRDDKGDGFPMYSSVGSLMKSISAPLLDKRMLLTIPVLAYSGLQQAFVWAEFTKFIVTPALGVSGVGGAMAVYGAADAICALVAGKFTTGLASITLFIFVGAFLQILVLLWLLLGYSLTSGILGCIYPLLMAAVWGVGDGVFNTQLNALFGLLFKHDLETAFAQLKVWQSASIAAVFFLSPCISLQAMLLVMVAALCISMLGFFLLTLHVERSPPHVS